MWKLWHRLFGWHYISFDFSYGNEIRRVETAPNGAKYVTCYGATYYMNQDGTFSNRNTGWIPLTWTMEQDDE